MQNQIDSIINSILSDKLTIKVNDLIDLSEELANGSYEKEMVHSFLEIGHFPQINTLFYESKLQERWLKSLNRLIINSKYHTGILLKQRVNRYSNEILFQTISGKHIKKITYSEIWQLISNIGSALISWTKTNINPVIGLYMPNRIETALIDLACLSFNFKIVPIPANVSKDHLTFILKHSGITHLFIDGPEQLNLLKNINNDFLELSIISLFKSNLTDAFISWDEFIKMQSRLNEETLLKRFNSVEMDADATIMYTSGTTANPKGIIFTQTNIISKRFARALALSNVNNNDLFLCYLPLYHTFGRFLELMGSIFWGATYCFAESPSFKSLVNNMQRIKPSIFISIPKRWLQFYELLNVQSSNSDKNEINKYVKEITGGNLRLGLSAAGYLDPDIFSFFHKYNIQLLSGYGMTEATGGITMTPENDYVKDSVGKPLPGIDVKLGKDNELMLKGPYVIEYYHDSKKKSALKNGWFHTGDIFREQDGHYFIIDRKKEIYKNSRGITISPQKIENLFQDFDSIKSVFLVGDGKPYNTVLLYPDNDWLDTLKQEEDFNVNDYFSSLIQSVNSFLAPYERIVNFALIDRDFSAEKGELTPKKTFKRKMILQNFNKYISPLYEKDYIAWLVAGNELRIPKWLLQKSGIMINDLRWDGKSLSLRNTRKNLSLYFNDKNIIIGDYKYTLSNIFLDLRYLVISPELWLGNQAFVEFFNFSSIIPKHFDPQTVLKLSDKSFRFGIVKVADQIIDEIKIALRDKLFDLQTLHKASLILYNKTDYNLSTAINYIAKVLSSEKTDLSELALSLLKRLRYHPNFRNRVKALEVITPFISGDHFIDYLIEIYNKSDNPKILKDLTLDVRLLKFHHFKSILNELANLRNQKNEFDLHREILTEALLNTITDFGIIHPTEYKWARSELIKWNLTSTSQYFIELANSLNDKLIDGFRNWLGNNRSTAIDSDNWEEYTWQDVIVFDPNVDDKYKNILKNSISQTALLKEAIFLLSNYRMVELDDIAARGVWIMYLGSNHGKNIFRVTVQTRNNNSYNFVINYNEKLSRDLIVNEVKWLISTGSSSKGTKLVEDFGGYWKDYKIFTEEYVQGETLFQYLERNRNQIQSANNMDIWQLRWLHFIWNGLMAYFSFYSRTNFKYHIANSSIKNLIIPEYDYGIGTRLVSISDKAIPDSKSQLFFSLYKNFILNNEKEYIGLPHVADWEVVFCSLLQTLTVKKGLEILRGLATEIGNSNKDGLNKKRINNFIEEINENGLLTKQVVFASLRYERWLALNPYATLQARSTMLRQLYLDYHLADLINDYPETRIRFYLMTAFKDSEEILKNELLNLQKGLRAKTISVVEFEERINHIIKQIKPNENDKYFITRLLFEHIDSPEPGKEFLWESNTEGKIELITAIIDNYGEKHQIRQANHPKEIAKFQTLLLNSNLPAVFNQQHEFLLIINQNNQIIGGVYWRKIDNETAYLERIVIHSKYRKRHLSSYLLDELFNRLKNKRFLNITVGFFQAGLFYNKGFHIDKQFGGLVKKLN